MSVSSQKSKKASSNILDKMVKLREARLSPNTEIIRTAQILVLLGLPTRPVKDRQITKYSRLGDGSRITVTFTAVNEGVIIPYGADTNLLHWMINRSINTQSPFVSWNAALEYLKFANMSRSGRNMYLLRERVKRIAGLAVSIQRKNIVSSETYILPIVRASRLPNSLMVDSYTSQNVLPFDENKKEKIDFGFQFDEYFFHDFIDNNVPMLKALIQLVGEFPQMQLFIGFLCWRSWAATSPSVIPWENLRNQLWHSDSNIWRIQKRFRDTIRALRVAWPEIQAEVLPHGLWIAPPEKGIQFLPYLPPPQKKVGYCNNFRIVSVKAASQIGHL